MKSLLVCLQLCAAVGAAGQTFIDPAPPTVHELAPIEAPKPQPNRLVRFHKAPKPLAADAVTSDWANFLGPTHNGVSTETRLLRNLPAGGPDLVWEMQHGYSYASPSIQGDYLVYSHRVQNEELVVAMHPETGSTYWEHRHPCTYRDRYGFGVGPRASPAIDGERVYTFGVEGELICFDLKTGRIIWQRDIMAEFKLKQAFFGIATSPVIEGDLLILNVGAAGGPCIAAFNKHTGAMVWGAGNQWGASYASPVPATVQGKRRIFVYTGGESRPPVGGLLSIDPVTGKIDWRIPWRSTTYESANAANPVVFDNKVLITASYQTGSRLVGVKPDMNHSDVWTNKEWGCHWSTPILHEGHLYAFEGRHPHTAALICADAKTGQVKWRHDKTWQEKVNTPRGPSQTRVGYMRGSLLRVDGAFLCLGEVGHLAWLDLSPDGFKERSRAWLFSAQQTWNVPVISRGLLYICQNAPDKLNRTRPRLLCYDLRATDD